MMELGEKELNQLREHTIALSDVEEQLNHFVSGFPQMDIVAPAVPGHGIMVLDNAARSEYEKCWSGYLDGDVRVVKFVPASGAASRMFKELYAYLDSGGEPSASVAEFIANADKFAFSDSLSEACVRHCGKSTMQLIEECDYKTVIACLLTAKGLNYGNLPKGLLLFHRYADGECRTPFLEHIAEGAAYACGKDRRVRLHYTVSPEFMERFKRHLAENEREYSDRFGVTLDVTFSVQKASTDTVAVNMDNTLFRDEDGGLLFRPGGHGALIENLNDIDADVIFVKNIDNVVPDRLKDVTVEYKRLLGGVAVSMQKQIFGFLAELEHDDVPNAKLMVMRQFVRNRLNVDSPVLETKERHTLIDFLRRVLDRPLRVCGMVKNEGEPGGGPFFVRDSNGVVALQILESSQFSAQQKPILDSATHFNPVDLVCMVKDYRGGKFDLKRYVDSNAGFISVKSKNGKEFKALELPGLWNGAMSDWNTVFVDVPLETFNPVKTVNDLLRPAHQ